MQKINIYICLSLVFFGCDNNEDSMIIDDLKLNQIQVIGSHNSYRINTTIDMHNLIASFQPDLAQDLDYGHPLLETQFSGAEILLEKNLPVASGIEELLSPGLKVLHFPDIDYRTHYYTFIDALHAVKNWSDQNPNHIPIFILIEAKEESLSSLYPSLSGFTQPLTFDNTALDAIDAEIRSVFGENLDKVITPDDIRGDNESLESVILNGGWPTIGESRGKIYFGLDNGGATRDAYVSGHPALAGRILFTASDPGTSEAAFLKLNTPTESISDFVSQGYIVRTRADADTEEARSGDTGPRDLALSSGAQFVSTDYYVADARADTSEDWTNYSVSLPGNFIARENPVSGSGNFFDTEIE